MRRHGCTTGRADLGVKTADRAPNEKKRGGSRHITGRTRRPPHREVAVRIEAADQAPVAAFAVGEQVVVERADVAADAARVAVLGPGRIVFVAGDIERLGDRRALQRDVLARSRAERLVEDSVDGTVIDDAVVAESWF
jgi:hypothetical protein